MVKTKMAVAVAIMIKLTPKADKLVTKRFSKWAQHTRIKSSSKNNLLEALTSMHSPMPNKLAFSSNSLLRKKKCKPQASALPTQTTFCRHHLSLKSTTLLKYSWKRRKKITNNNAKFWINVVNSWKSVVKMPIIYTNKSSD